MSSEVPRWRARLASLLLRRGLARHSPRAVARAWRLLTVPMAIDGLEVTRGARRLLLLPKVGGVEDVVAALTGRGDVGLEVVTLPRREVKRVFAHFCGHIVPPLGDVDYVRDDPAIDEAKRSYRAFLADVVGHYAPSVRLAGIVTANVAYFAERELAGACEEVGVPFLALHKESIRTTAQRERFTRAYREHIGAFTGRAVAVYNEDERASMVAGGIATSERVRVVGCPRIDGLHVHRETASARDVTEHDTIVLFAVDPVAGTWSPLTDAGPAPRWDALAEATERAVIALAREHPERRVVIKVKLGREGAVTARLPGALPANVEVVTGGVATDLLTRASVAVAFNSTVILEAIAAGVPVIVPVLAGADDTPAWRYELTGAVVEVGAEDALTDAILATASPRPLAALTAPMREALTRYVGDADGHAGDRAFAFLAEHLDLHRPPPSART